MIDVDEKLATGNAGADFSEAIKTCRIGGNDAVEFMSPFGLLKEMVGIEELVFFRERVRTTESSIRNLSVGVYFRITARATRPWMRLRWRMSRPKPRFCCSGEPRMLMKTRAECRSPATSTSLTVTSPTSLTGNSRRIASPISRLSNSRTRCIRREAIAQHTNCMVYKITMLHGSQS